MTPDELEALRTQVVQLNALVQASTDSASTIPGTDAKLERTQALLAIACRHSEHLVLKMEIAAAPRKFAVV